MGAQPSLYRIQSQLATRQQLDEAPAQRWISEMRIRLVISRKTWERVYVLQALYAHGMLRPGRRGLGFGVGSDPMIPVMVNYGCRVVATDYGSSGIKGWGFGLELNPKGVADPDRFNGMVEVRCVDMNNIPSDLKGFDFIWSCGSLEHIGGLHRGLVFAESAMDCLRPGGVAVHTTELNLSEGDRTLGTPTLSFYLPEHINDLAVRLNNAGHLVLPINYQTGNTPDDLHKAQWPFDPPCIRIIHSGFEVTSLGITIVAHVERGRKDLSVLPVNDMKSGLEILKQSNIKIPQEPDASGRVLCGIVAAKQAQDIAKKRTAAPRVSQDASPNRRPVDYLRRHYPVIMSLGRFGKWSLITLKNTSLGIGGIFLFVVAGLYVAGALVEPLRWYLVGIATGLLFLYGGLLALSYARLWLDRFASAQHRSIQSVRDQSIRDRTQLKATLDELKKALRASEATLAELKKEISDSKDTLAKMNVGNFPLFQQLNRRLTNEDLKRFAGEWAPKLGLNLHFRALGYMAHRICLAEDTCVGYLAGNIETMLLRVLVARSVKEPNVEVLEIGTLFGVGVAMIHESCRGLFSGMHFTVIDPLIGHIGRHDKSSLDAVTKAPATREIFIHNMQRMNIPESDYTIIEKLSTEDEAIEQASKRRYNVLIIDGDHSYFGVKHDFHTYRHLVKRGGYIIFDDYGNPSWPGLTDFVDKEVASTPELEFVGTDVYSAVFRVIGPEGLTGASGTNVAGVTTKDEGRRGSSGSEGATPLELRHIRKPSATTPAIEFSRDRTGESKQGEGNAGVLRFGTDTVYVSADHFRAVEDNGVKRELLKRTVQRVAIEIFSYCNRQCWFCPNASGQRRKEQSYLDEAIFLGVVNDLGWIDYDNVLMLHLYNEPLADRIVLDRIRQARAVIPKAKVEIATNGDYLDRDYLKELVDAGVHAISVGIYGPDNGVFVEDYALRRIYTLAQELGLGNGPEVKKQENLYEIQGLCQGIRIRITAKDMNKLGFDRGALVAIENRPRRTCPCFAPFIDLDIDYRGNLLPCCNIYCDDERHKQYVTGNLHDGRSIFDHYTAEELVTWRRNLFGFYPTPPPCVTCPRKEFPALSTDANVQEFERLCARFALDEPSGASRQEQHEQ